MVFRSYTYDASEVDLQYFLDDEGNEVHEIVIDENAFTGWWLESVHFDISLFDCLIVIFVHTMHNLAKDVWKKIK